MVFPGPTQFTLVNFTPHLLVTAGFFPARVPGYVHTSIDPYIYHCVDPLNPLLNSTICVTVDGIKGIGFHQRHLDLLCDTLQHRYGSEVTFDYNFNKYAGQQYHPQANGGLTIDCSQFIQEMLKFFAIVNVDGAFTSTSSVFFYPTTDSSHFDTVKCQKATGALT